jgi:hypothetical protein
VTQEANKEKLESPQSDIVESKPSNDEAEPALKDESETKEPIETKGEKNVPKSENKQREPEVVNSRAAAMGTAPNVKREVSNS